MDLKGSLLDTDLKIYVSKKALEFLKTIPITQKLPLNIQRIIKQNVSYEPKSYVNGICTKSIHINNDDIANLNKIIKTVETSVAKENGHADDEIEDKENENKKKNKNEDIDEQFKKYYLHTTDLDWLYNYIKSKHNEGDKSVPYLHELLEGSHIEVPKNEVVKRNPDLEARCVKLRAQQEAREYRKMTKGVDNVRMRFPEDSISYQLKQVNRQLIAIGQFIISIFAGFLFGFTGVQLMVGDLDFGFRLLLGVMCALVIALAEIYFLAKKLNEELNIPETVQLGGPSVLANENKHHLD